MIPRKNTRRLCFSFIFVGGGGGGGGGGVESRPVDVGGSAKRSFYSPKMSPLK